LNQLVLKTSEIESDVTSLLILNENSRFLKELIILYCNVISWKP